MYTVGDSIGNAVSDIFWYIVIASIILLLLVTGLMIFFAVKYSRKRHPKPEAVKQRAWLEIVWTAIPTVLVLSMFYYGYEGFKLMRTVPKDAMTIKVTGRMWNWAFDYPNGKHTDNLYVPIDTPIKLELKSTDVLHSFHMPAFRIKEDVVPGKDNYLWFKPNSLGSADIFCAEFCGQRHAYMLSKVIVLKKDEFDKWYNEGALIKSRLDEVMKSPAVKLMDEHGCLSCHALEIPVGEQVPFKGIFGKKQIVVKDGKEVEVTVDEAYLRRAILEPGAELRKGFPNMMDPVTDLSEEQLKLIIDFLKEYK